jgi:hypothetical protein
MKGQIQWHTISSQTLISPSNCLCRCGNAVRQGKSNTKQRLCNKNSAILKGAVAKTLRLFKFARNGRYEMKSAQAERSATLKDLRRSNLQADSPFGLSVLRLTDGWLHPASPDSFGSRERLSDQCQCAIDSHQFEVESAHGQREETKAGLMHRRSIMWYDGARDISLFPIDGERDISRFHSFKIVCICHRCGSCCAFFPYDLLQH